VSIGLAIGVIAGSVAFMVALMLLVRSRLAPAGGHFRDSDRASGVFAFVGAGFAILLGFVILLSFEGYNGAKSHSEEEATAVFDQYEVAALFEPASKRNVLWGELVCYARAVIADEWPAMEHGGRSPLVDRWTERLESQVPSAEIATRAESLAYQQWFEEAAARDNARRQRLLEASGTLPALLWLMLIIGAVGVVGFVLLYADPGERALGQGCFAGGVTAIVVTSLLAVALLASPFQGGNGSIGPKGMRYTLRLIEEEAAQLHDPLATPCDAAGRPI
jgi:hypothetical protein